MEWHRTSWNLLDFVDLDLWGHRDYCWGWLLNLWMITESGAWQSRVGPQAPGTHPLLSLTRTSGDFRLSGLVFLLERFAFSVPSSIFVMPCFRTLCRHYPVYRSCACMTALAGITALPLENCYCAVETAWACGQDHPGFKPGLCHIFAGLS